jgi:biopolymer transport protein ExbB/TolQ
MENINLSPIGLFTQAGPVGKTVIFLLGIASVWCWYQIFEGIKGIYQLKSGLNKLKKNQSSKLLDPIIQAGLFESKQLKFAKSYTNCKRY